VAVFSRATRRVDGSGVSSTRQVDMSMASTRADVMAGPPVTDAPEPSNWRADVAFDALSPLPPAVDLESRIGSSDAPTPSD